MSAEIKKSRDVWNIWGAYSGFNMIANLSRKPEQLIPQNLFIKQRGAEVCFNVLSGNNTWYLKYRWKDIDHSLPIWCEYLLSWSFQYSRLVVTQIFLYFPLFDFGMECCMRFQQTQGTENPRRCRMRHSPCRLFIKQRGVEVCFNFTAKAMGIAAGKIYRRSRFRQPRGIGPRPHDFGSLKCIELFLQPPAGWSLSHWLHQYILVDDE